jgi:SAM-dependent methyltransferase
MVWLKLWVQPLPVELSSLLFWSLSFLLVATPIRLYKTADVNTQLFNIMIEKKLERVGAQEGYDLWSETYDSTPNPVVTMDSRHTIKLLAPEGGELILDAGCGTGRNLRPLLLAGSTAVGIDFSFRMLQVARRAIDKAPVALADLQASLPFENGAFDAVLCALIGEHLSDLRAVFDEVHRVLRPGARLVFSVYHPEMSAAGIEANFEREGTEYRLGAIHYSVAEHVRLLEEGGFEGIQVHEFRGDEELINAVPSAAKYLDCPVLLVVTGTKWSSAGDLTLASPNKSGGAPQAP